jgi:predicted regulator of Ras-like GTPase activity (Roadblock/LC7/MglB family)
MTAPASTAPVSSGRDFRELLRGLIRIEHVQGGLIVATDGLVIAAEMPAGVQIEPLSALAATLGRELELRSPALKRGAFVVTSFDADNGLIFLGTTPIGFLVMVAAAEGRSTVRAAFRQALAALTRAWGGRALAR